MCKDCVIFDFTDCGCSCEPREKMHYDPAFGHLCKECSHWVKEESQ